ncbi:methyltransferase [Mariniblastus fucicola]|uniref:Methyltransferase domain-containing protein n=1 Tax=Mariniblastus fucicola TaxID=980251 RepID=A0A5B9PIT5_9BACT|nr:methyltransferase [Mariniblastus fucicola]QEG25195.1 hypothetical protein MFFC18_51190 [Mariniblastus fucicola]
MNSVANCRFKFFPQLNDLEQTQWLGSRQKFHAVLAEEYFGTDSLQDKFLQAIAAERLLPIKEVLESFEFFTRIRKSTRQSTVADLCCGHGLLGILFAMFERDVERVILIDQNEPESRQKLIAAASRVAPWIEAKLQNHSAKIGIDGSWIETGMAVVSAHACGVLSDLCIDIAIKSGGPIAILPCCYPKSACSAPLSLQTQFGMETAFDIDRTYRLEAAGYRIRWGSIPEEITPMNRIIYGRTP